MEAVPPPACSAATAAAPPPACSAATTAAPPPACSAAMAARPPPSCSAAMAARPPPSCSAAMAARPPPSCSAAMAACPPPSSSDAMAPPRPPAQDNSSPFPSHTSSAMLDLAGGEDTDEGTKKVTGENGEVAEHLDGGEIHNQKSCPKKREQKVIRPGVNNELDCYLKEPLVTRKKKVKILQWWKVNSSTYPVLSTMARDILATSASTVPSESAFSTGGRVVSDYRSRLSPSTVEMLICLQDWFKASDALDHDE